MSSQSHPYKKWRFHCPVIQLIIPRWEGSRPLPLGGYVISRFYAFSWLSLLLFRPERSSTRLIYRH